MTGTQLVHAFEDGPRLCHVAVSEVLFDRKRVYLARQPGMQQQRLELRAEDPHAVCKLRVEERLHAQPVAREKQRLPVAVPQRKSEHAAETLHAVLTPCL